MGSYISYTRMQK